MTARPSALRFAVLLPLVLSTSSDPGRRRLPTIVLITLDTTRADFCSLHGHANATTPTLVGLGPRGVVFDAAMAPATWTLPSHASLWTGLYPRLHGAVSSLTPSGEEYGRPLPRDVPTLPAVLSRAGYQTAGFPGGPFLHRGLGFGASFEHYDGRLDDYGLAATEVNRRVAEWLAGGRDERPLFLFVNYYDPHRPYAPPAAQSYPFAEGEDCGRSLPVDFDPATSGRLHSPLEVRCARSLYAREIYAMDVAVADLLGLLERRGELADAVVAVVGDHGEAFGEHGVWTHGGPGFLHQRRVPMLLLATARASGARRRVAEPVSIVRLPRTLVEWAGVPAPEGWLGPSLISTVSAGLPPLTERFMRDASYFTLSYPGWSYLRTEAHEAAPTERLFDLAADPGEQVDLASRRDRADAAAMLERARAAWNEMTRRWGPASAPEGTVEGPDEQRRQRLRALGYLR